MASAVSRCIAVAAHGRRCQQSRYKGSPYCWHHMQSRKVPAPSRLRSSSRREQAAPPVELAAVAAAQREAEAALALRLMRILGRDTSAQVLQALESDPNGSITLIRHTGGVAVWRAPARARATGTG
ncbi:MAG: hypothetical protein AB1416_01380 [Actinomycetota bacterium]